MQLRPRLSESVRLYDALYRARHHLDTAESEVGPVLRIEFTPSPWVFRFRDGTVVRRGERIGVVHMNNEAVVALHARGRSPMGIGLEFRRRLFDSLRVLADRLVREPDLRDVHALTATTILHAHMRRLGFEVQPGALLSPRLVALYQRALLAWLHPAGRLRVRRGDFSAAARLWISRATLIERYGPQDIAARTPSGAPAGDRPLILRGASVHVPANAGGDESDERAGVEVDGGRSMTVVAIVIAVALAAWLI